MSAIRMARQTGSYSTVSMELDHGTTFGSADSQDWSSAGPSSPRSQHTAILRSQSGDISLPAALQRSASSSKMPLLPDDDPYSKEEKKKDEKVVFGEKEVHFIPVTLLLCAFILYLYHILNPEEVVHLPAREPPLLDTEAGGEGRVGRRLLSWGAEAMVDRTFSFTHALIQVFGIASEWVSR